MVALAVITEVLEVIMEVLEVTVEVLEATLLVEIRQSSFKVEGVREEDMEAVVVLVLELDYCSDLRLELGLVCNNKQIIVSNIIVARI